MKPLQHCDVTRRHKTSQRRHKIAVTRRRSDAFFVTSQFVAFVTSQFVAIATTCDGAHKSFRRSSAGPLRVQHGSMRALGGQRFLASCFAFLLTPLH